MGNHGVWDVVDARENLVVLVLSRDLTCAQAAACLDVSRQTMQGYVSRYRDAGVVGLVPCSRRPHSSPWQLPQWVEDEIMRVRKEHPRWGARKIRWTLEAEPQRLGGFALPAASTVHRVLERHGEVLGARTGREADGAALRRFRAKAPNLLWQIDAWKYVLDTGQLVWVLDVLDDFSRFLLGCRVVPAVTTEAAWELLRDLVAAYGLPAALLSDNDLAFTGRATGNHSVLFERQVRAAGISITHGRPHHPQTQGKVERSHGTVEDWLEDEPPAVNIIAFEQQLDRYRDEYNHHRPHDALNGDMPAQHYQRGIPVLLPLAELEPADPYPDGAIMRKVKPSGAFRYNSDDYDVGTKYAGITVGLIHRGARLYAYYGAAEIGTWAIGYQPPARSSSQPPAPQPEGVKVERPQRSEDERP